MKYADQVWVMLTHGVQSFPPGTQISVYLEPADVMQFSADGRAMTTVREAA